MYWYLCLTEITGINYCKQQKVQKNCVWINIRKLTSDTEVHLTLYPVADVENLICFIFVGHMVQKWVHEKVSAVPMKAFDYGVKFTLRGVLLPVFVYQSGAYCCLANKLCWYPCGKT